MHKIETHVGRVYSSIVGVLVVNVDNIIVICINYYYLQFLVELLHSSLEHGDILVIDKES